MVVTAEQIRQDAIQVALLAARPARLRVRRASRLGWERCQVIGDRRAYIASLEAELHAMGVDIRIPVSERAPDAYCYWSTLRGQCELLLPGKALTVSGVRVQRNPVHTRSYAMSAGRGTVTCSLDEVELRVWELLHPIHPDLTAKQRLLSMRCPNGSMPATCVVSQLCRCGQRFNPLAVKPGETRCPLCVGRRAA